MKDMWPTLEGRLKHALTSREVAVRQLQLTTTITQVAQNVLNRSNEKNKHRSHLVKEAK